ncbi:MAG: 3-keto-disaccharide hydrolase [Thermoguttaceae bacterium]
MSTNVKWIVLCTFAACSVVTTQANDWRSGIDWEKPAVVAPGATAADPPADAIILFDGTNLDAWKDAKWTVKDKELIVAPGKGDLSTKQKFGSVQLHLEFATPTKVEGSGQGRGNSGLFFMDHYEVQILDSYNNDTYYDGQCAGIYKQRPPLVNACRAPGEWQTYDVIFTRPELKIEDGKVVEVVRPAFITVIQNGVLVVYNHPIEGDTFYHIPPAYQPHGEKEPIRLQDHGNLTKFRNIWVREIPDTYEKPKPSREPYYIQ